MSFARLDGLNRRLEALQQRFDALQSLLGLTEPLADRLGLSGVLSGSQLKQTLLLDQKPLLELKQAEITQANREKAEAQRLGKLEQTELDEMGISRFQRAKKAETGEERG